MGEKLLAILKTMIDKGTSGRFLLTFISGLVFFYSVKYRMLDNATIASIVVMVFVSYFQRQDRNGTPTK